MAILDIVQLHCAYNDRPVLRGIDLRLEPGELAALIGPNGSGKTTLLRCITGQMPSKSGRVLVQGVDVAASPASARARLGCAIEPDRLPALLTGTECLRLFADARGLGRIPAESLAFSESLNLTPMLDRSVASYSLGARQKLGIVLGLLGQPPLLILDEPLNGLDPLSAYRLKDHLSSLARERGATVLLTTHALDVAERLASRVILLMDGLVARSWVACDLENIRTDPTRSLETEMIRATSPGSIP